MSNNEIVYISFDEVLEVYQKTIEKSGGGLAGILDQGKVESIIFFIIIIITTIILYYLLIIL